MKAKDRPNDLCPRCGRKGATMNRDEYLCATCHDRRRWDFDAYDYTSREHDPIFNQSVYELELIELHERALYDWFLSPEG